MSTPLKHELLATSCTCTKVVGEEEPAVLVEGHLFRTPKGYALHHGQLVRMLNAESEPIGIRFSIRYRNGVPNLHINSLVHHRKRLARLGLLTAEATAPAEGHSDDE